MASKSSKRSKNKTSKTIFAVLVLYSVVITALLLNGFLQNNKRNETFLKYVSSYKAAALKNSDGKVGKISSQSNLSPDCGGTYVPVYVPGNCAFPTPMPGGGALTPPPGGLHTGCPNNPPYPPGSTNTCRNSCLSGETTYGSASSNDCQKAGLGNLCCNAPLPIPTRTPYQNGSNSYPTPFEYPINYPPFEFNYPF